MTVLVWVLGRGFFLVLVPPQKKNFFFARVGWIGCRNVAVNVTQGTALLSFWFSLGYLRVCFP